MATEAGFRSCSIRFSWTRGSDRAAPHFPLDRSPLLTFALLLLCFSSVNFSSEYHKYTLFA